VDKFIKEDCFGIIDELDLSPLRNSSILLTGSNGLLGTYIVHLIYWANKTIDLDCKIYCLSLNKPKAAIQELIGSNVIPVQMDLSKPFSIDYEVDYIFHAACYGQPKKFMENKISTIKLNIDATHTLLEAAKENNAKLMFFSSGEVYGRLPGDLTSVPESYNGDCSTTGPRAVYAESKRLGETLCAVYGQDYGLKAYVARIGHTYGPGISIHDERVIGNFIKKALTESSIRMLDQGEKIKTFGYTADITKMLVTVMLNGTDLIYNISGIDTISIRELAQRIADYSKVRVIMPYGESDLEHISKDQEYVKLDTTKFIQEFGKPNFTTLNDGLIRTIDWNKSQFDL